MRQATASFERSLSWGATNMPSENGRDATETLLDKAERVTKTAKGSGLCKATSGAIELRIAQVREAVQARRDAPSTLLGCAVFFGIMSGLVAYVYSAYFEGMLWVVWEVGPPAGAA